MAINRFDKPANLAVRDTFVPQTVQVPFEELSFGLQQKQTTFLQNEDILQKGLLSLDINAIEEDRQERNREITRFEGEFEELVNTVSGDLSLAGSQARDFSRKIGSNLTRGKLAAIQNRFKERQAFFGKIDKQVEDGKLSANKASLLKQLSKTQTPQLQNEDGSFNSIGEFPVSEEVSVFERGLELTKRLAKDGSLPGLKFDQERGIIVDIQGEGISPEKAFKSAFQAIANDRLSVDSLNQDASLLQFTAGEDLDEEALDAQIGRLITLNNRSTTGEIVDLEVEQDIKTALGSGSVKDKLRVLGELKAANDIANQIAGNKFTRNVKGIPGFGQRNDQVFGGGVVVPIKTKFKPSTFNSPEKITQAKRGLKQSLDQALNTKAAFLRDNNITQDNPISPDGIDLSGRLAEINAGIKQIELDQQDLLAGEKRVMESVGLSTEDIRRINNIQVTPEKIEEITQRVNAQIGTRDSQERFRGRSRITPERAQELIQQQIANEAIRIRENDPAYAKYKEALKRNAEAQNLVVGVVQIADAKTKKATEGAVKTILGNIGLGEASQRVQRLGTEVDADDIVDNDVIGSMNEIFVDGVSFLPDSNDIQVVFQAADKEDNLLGRFSTKAPKGIVTALIQENQFEFLDIALHDFANSVRNSFDRKGSLMGITFDVQSQTEVLNNTTKPYVVIINKRLPDGRVIRSPKEFSSEGEALNRIKKLIINKLRASNTK